LNGRGGIIGGGTPTIDGGMCGGATPGGNGGRLKPGGGAE